MKTLCALLAFISVVSGSAQIQTDSLRSVWQDKSLADTARLNAVQVLILDNFLNSDPDSALYFAGLHYDLAKEKGLKKYMAMALRMQGRAFSSKGEHDKASDQLDKSVTMFKELGAKDELAVSYMYLGNVHLDLLQYDSAYFQFDRSIKVYLGLNDSAGLATVLLRKAYTAQNSAEYTEAMEYAFEALRIWEKLGNDAGMADAYVELGNILYYQNKYVESIEYGKQALEIMDRIGDQDGAAAAYHEIGESYLILEEYELALDNINKALKIKESLNSPPISISSTVNSRGNVYKYLEDYDNALADYKRAMQICEDQGFDLGIMATSANVGHVSILKGEFEEALPPLFRSTVMMEASDHRMNIAENYMHVSTALEGLGRYEESLMWYQKYNTTKDSIFTAEKDHTLSELRTEYETEKKEEQIASLEKEAQLKELARERDQQIRILLIATAILLVLLAIGLWNRLTFTRKSRAIIQKEKDRSEELLLNILPEEVAGELKEKGHADAQLIEHVTVLFTDFKGFTAMSEKLSPKDLVSDLNLCFSEFDLITSKYGIEKIKTIGDAYMAAGGLPTPNTTHATDVIKAALEMRDFVEAGKARKIEAGLPYFEIRIGVHTGPVVAGIVGVKKFQYDIWGDTVNTASRMESSGEVGQVNISETTYELVKKNSEFGFTSRGKIEAKGKGEMEMFFVGEKNDG